MNPAWYLSFLENVKLFILLHWSDDKVASLCPEIATG